MPSRIKLEIAPIEEDGFHIFISSRINGKKARLLIDTGASRTVFDKDRIRQFIGRKKIKLEKMDKLSIGLGTNSLESHSTVLKTFKLGRILLENYKAVVLDMIHVNQSYSMLGMEMIDGVLGGDLLVELNAVVNYQKKVLVIS